MAAAAPPALFFGPGVFSRLRGYFWPRRPGYFLAMGRVRFMLPVR
jgi:hypothetical protein